ncbi:hypothetical protein ACH5RR_027407 [Cinchona calisaya]|uniref:Thioredoxin domain-containing protein n=1 Tax=Cinchona calisaya TaxID=153742 RepID=A0ABD2Z8N1_9GENT
MVAFFSATWSDDCRLINPSVEKDAKDFPQVIFVKVDVDELPNVAKKYQVSSEPTFTFFEKGAIVDKYVGKDITVLRNLISKHV